MMRRICERKIANRANIVKDVVRERREGSVRWRVGRMNGARATEASRLTPDASPNLDVAVDWLRLCEQPAREEEGIEGVPRTRSPPPQRQRIPHNGCLPVLPLMPHKGVANNPLPHRPPSRPAALLPPPIPHILSPRRRTISERCQIQTQRRAGQEEEEGFDIILHARPSRCAAVQLG